MDNSIALFSLFTIHFSLNYIIIPANVPDIYDAKVPAIKALKPKRAKSARLEGSKALMPPIWIPTEPKFAKPHKAKLTMTNVLGSIVVNIDLS